MVVAITEHGSKTFRWPLQKSSLSTDLYQILVETIAKARAQYDGCVIGQPYAAISAPTESLNFIAFLHAHPLLCAINIICHT